MAANAELLLFDTDGVESLPTNTLLTNYSLLDMDFTMEQNLAYPLTLQNAPNLTPTNNHEKGGSQDKYSGIQQQLQEMADAQHHQRQELKEKMEQMSNIINIK